MTYLSTDEVIRLHELVIRRSGGSAGVRDHGLVDSAVGQPRAGFSGHEFYPTLPEKAAALGYSLAMNHAFVDGNKRIAHAALELFLVMNGHELDAEVDEQEATFLALAAGQLAKPDFFDWVRAHVVPLTPAP
ncbi:MAG: type II toxin-antitoxin system death-on-curing family toxin [Gemmataceae bacterium]